MANLSLELLTTGQGFSPIQVKGENMTHPAIAYHRKSVHLNTYNAIISRHTTARARRDMASSGQLILNLVHQKLQPTHTSAIISRHTTARARRDMASSGQLILNSVHQKLQPTHTSGLRTRAH